MPERADHEHQVRAQLERWADAVCRGDMEGVLADHAPDVVMYDVPEPVQCKGLEAYRQTWELFFQENGFGPGLFRLQDLQVHAGEEVAVAHALLAIGGGPARCRLTVGLRRIGGRWTVLHEHHSMPIAL